MLKIKNPVPAEDDAYYLTAMHEGEKSNILNELEKKEFIISLNPRVSKKEV